MEEELRPSLAHVVAVADEERRRVERELHDVAQQHLVALTVNAQLARELGVSDMPAALDLLDEVARDARGALEAVRALAARVYPPLLLDRGLAEALRAAAAACPVRTRVEVDALDRHPAAVEAAAYFCCADVLDAAVTGPVRVRAWQEDGALHVAIAPGTLPAASIARERVAALSGRLDVDGDGVMATIPLTR
ncbi:MAG TPA: histidine kinase dimerization/phosphoacceptor domain-containing protein [Gaiellaceae bacterium]|jgi:signal transduction histidine kinase|nr:histidine kinase dimerization/phosphoacceptor domain-containing protein [Gaiellaceae bacterium]